ncbi:MAG: hypothetical protein ABSH30_13810 [Acidimicrobiales bacterium]
MSGTSELIDGGNLNRSRAGTGRAWAGRQSLLKAARVMLVAAVVAMAAVAAPLSAAAEARTPSRPGVSPAGTLRLRGLLQSTLPGLPGPGGAALKGSANTPAPGEASGSSWKIKKSPNVVDKGGLLASESCSAANACTAVGDYVDSSGIEVNLAEAWNGKSWSVKKLPKLPGAEISELSGVSCTSTGTCTAVGQYVDSSGVDVTLAEFWDGSSWSIQATPNPAGAQGSGLFSVSCTSAGACTAVGIYVDSSGVEVTLAEAWDGASWSIQTTPNPAGSQESALSAVSCTSAGTCTAVEGAVDASGVTVTLAEFWDGSSWSIQATPNPSGAQASALYGVSCTSTGTCTAVGISIDSSGVEVTLAEEWDGASWSIQATPNPAGALDAILSSVSCTSASACTAVGQYTASSLVHGTLAEAWDGISWSVQATPNPADAQGSLLAGVACTSANACTAVGISLNSSGVEVSLAEVWKANSWSIKTTPNPAGVEYSFLLGVSCTGASACVAVGLNLKDSDVEVPLAESWNGKSWTVQATPNPAGAQESATLSGVSCTAANACTAVGEYTNGSGVTVTLAESWDGTSWSIQATPNPSGAEGSSLSGVSCTGASSCTAVGDYSDGSGGEETLVEAWDGTSWSIQATPNPSGAQESGLSGVSCTLASACTAVGSSTDSSDNQTTLAESWDGGSWSIEATPNPSGAEGSSLSGVSCTTAGACTAVGGSTDGSDDLTTLAESWDGGSWSIEATPNPAGAQESSLSGVSCTTAGACTAVGESADSSGVQTTLAESWGGTSWTLQATPNPAAARVSTLSGVSCTSACTGAGYYATTGVALTLVEVGP